MMINLDKAATTRPTQSFLNNIVDIAEDYYNPSSANSMSIEVRRAIERTREEVAEFFNVKPDDIYFVSGASEGNAMVVDGFKKKHKQAKIYISEVEHPSLLNNENVDYRLHVDGEGRIKYDELDDVEDGSLVSIGYANSEVGTIQDMNVIIDKLHKKNCFVMSDLTTVAGKLKIDITSLDLDAAVFSGHKFHALKGVGVVYVKDKEQLSPIVYGTQEGTLRGGTLNSLAIRSLSYALKNIVFEENIKHMNELKNILRNGLENEYYFKNICHINTPSENSMPNILNFSLDLPLTAQQIVTFFDDRGIIVSAGTACASYEELPSPTLMAMGIGEDRARHSIRVSWDEENTVRDMYNFLQILRYIVMVHKTGL